MIEVQPRGLVARRRRRDRLTDAPILDRLRRETDADHRALEDALGLLEPPLSRERFAAALAGFAAFHRAWEPRVEAILGPLDGFAPHRRLDLIARDLEALGAADVGDAPDVDLAWLDGRDAAWGSLYVMEGSALGGQVISRALAKDAPWAPAGGLLYFNPNGAGTGARWRAFREALEAAGLGLDADGVVAGARAAFSSLKATLRPEG